MFTLHATRKLLDRLKHPAVSALEDLPTTRLGNWYATALFWKPQAVLAVNERSLLPVLLPLAPAATIAQRLPDALGPASSRWASLRTSSTPSSRRCERSRSPRRRAGRCSA